jgi:hypothetical protein
MNLRIRTHVLSRRRLMAAAGLAMVSGGSRAHHGWSAFDQDQPLYLAGQAADVRWQNPHAQLRLQVDAALQLPADLGRRPVPAQQQQVDGPALLGKARLPTAAAGAWEIELAPLSRMQAWQVPPLKDGDRIEVIGYRPRDGSRLMRVEYLFVAGRTYALRSGPSR